jgi:hypothetical protein
MDPLWAPFPYQMGLFLDPPLHILLLILDLFARFVLKLVIVPNYALGDMIRIMNENRTLGLKHIICRFFLKTMTQQIGLLTQVPIIMLQVILIISPHFLPIMVPINFK